MAKVFIHEGIEDKIVSEGKYEYAEGGIEKDGKPSFHMCFGTSFSVYMIFDNKEEFKEFLEDLKKQILSK